MDTLYDYFYVCIVSEVVRILIPGYDLTILQEVVSLDLNRWPSLGHGWYCLLIRRKVSVYDIKLVVRVWGNISLIGYIRSELTAWWGTACNSWVHLASARIVVC